MHKLASTPITLDCFENYDIQSNISRTHFEAYVQYLEELRCIYNETKDEKYWKELIIMLPESWKQTRTVTMNYENILNICKQREGHKLIEWQSFIVWARILPYANELLFIN